MGQRESLFTDEGRWRRPLGTSTGHYLRTIDRREGFGNTRIHCTPTHHTHTHTALTQKHTHPAAAPPRLRSSPMGAKGWKGCAGDGRAVKMEIRSRPQCLSFRRTRRNGILIVAHRNRVRVCVCVWVCVCVRVYIYYYRQSSLFSPSPFLLITWIESNFLAYKYDFVYTLLFSPSLFSQHVIFRPNTDVLYYITHTYTHTTAV